MAEPWDGGARRAGLSKSLKTAVVRALRAGLSAAPLVAEDPILSRASVGLEYPVTQVVYPAIWVTAQLRGVQWEQMGLAQPGDEMRVGQFESTVSLEVMALSNEERDTLVDAVLNMVLFAHLESETNVFRRTLVGDELVRVAPLTAAPTVGAENVTVGTPWDPVALAYTRTVGFDLFGEFVARVGDPLLVPLRRVDGVIGDGVGAVWEGTLAPGNS